MNKTSVIAITLLFIKVSGYRNSIYKKNSPIGTWLAVKGLALPDRQIEIDMEAHKAK